ncbi:response regulator [Microlunatus parietis]|uniref:DNA-binding NarL/FixJ family response regulator n=1 Tax=Microlunatus parietis TaxID=682979 RepID=A0A7Y9LCN3_9ACTN|nr:response regulator transcription factor [Microlunatus parietis]NYE72013.1 DNA-binding NarL/FixJ family response regulator [Microlunatus parietis]
MIKVYLVDDTELIRTGCAMVINAQPDLTVVGQAGSGAEALRELAETPADVVLLDIRMPGLDGIEVVRRLVAAPGPTPKIIVLTTFDLDEYALAALTAGAQGFLLKDAPAADLLAAIRSVHEGSSVLAPATARRLFDLLADRVDHGGPDVAAQLTEREREVVILVATGAGNAEIAAQLFVSTSTVKAHIASILRKLDLRDRIHIVIWAYEHRFVRPS